jgi:hypothetical protein
MSFRTVIVCAVIVLGCAASASAQAVSLKFNNGRVTLNAQNATIRTILIEWSRLGGTRIVNGERVGGAPVTLELTDIPERQALDILLRSAAGYVVTAKQGTTGLSSVGGVVILATSSAPRPQAPVTFGATTVQPPPQRPLFDQDPEERQERPGVVAAPVLPTTLQPASNQPAVVRFPTNTSPTPFGQTQTDPAQPAQAGPQRPSTTVQTLPGSSRPGEISPPPQPQPQPQDQPQSQPRR